MMSAEPESALFCRSDDTGRGEIKSVVFDSAFFVRKLSRSRTERYARDILELLHSQKLDIEEKRDNLKSRKLCGELMQESFS